MTILQDFQESLAKSFRDQEDERDQFFGTLVQTRAKWTLKANCSQASPSES
jgi:hypothetical protein